MVKVFIETKSGRLLKYDLAPKWTYRPKYTENFIEMEVVGGAHVFVNIDEILTMSVKHYDDRREEDDDR